VFNVHRQAVAAKKYCVSDMSIPLYALHKTVLHSHVLAAELHYCSTPALTHTVLALRFAASRFEPMLRDSFKMFVTFLVTIGLLCLSFALSSVSASAKNVSELVCTESRNLY
jgi:hypothetical protein